MSRSKGCQQASWGLPWKCLECYKYFQGRRSQVAPLMDEVENMFSHEGVALEVLLFIFGSAGLLLVVWFLHSYYERKTGKVVKKQQSR
ncbi:hypothetical protein [Pseudomonas citrulli]|uniref:Uncharacterized protein n=1 Tax=Pseudomonas citrulli TaxID=3064347 RepID=A0ABT9BX01_9PSED|nr:hypothetical protein [Pseudomonas sp. K18]MDO7897076.1 hypothetical protein [Pseudomonas sp. K18]